MRIGCVRLGFRAFESESEIHIVYVCIYICVCDNVHILYVCRHTHTCVHTCILCRVSFVYFDTDAIGLCACILKWVSWALGMESDKR